MSFIIEKLVNMESRFYKNIESNNLNSKKLEIIESYLMQNSHLQNLCHVPTLPPFCKIKTNLSTANFANNVDENIESRFYKSIESTNLDSKKVMESKTIKSVDCHENSCEFSRNDSKDSIKNIESKKEKLDSKNKRIKTSSDSLTLNRDVRSTNLVSPPVAQCEKSEKANAEVHSPLFLQSDRLAGLAPFKKKKRLLFFAKGARGGGFALFCAMCKNETNNVLLKNREFGKIESENDLLKNSNFRKLDSIESKNAKDSKQDFKIMESKKIDSINLSPTHHPIKINMKG